MDSAQQYDRAFNTKSVMSNKYGIDANTERSNSAYTYRRYVSEGTIAPASTVKTEIGSLDVGQQNKTSQWHGANGAGATKFADLRRSHSSSSKTSMSSDHSNSTSPETRKAWENVRERSPTPIEGAPSSRSSSVISNKSSRPSSCNSATSLDRGLRRSSSVDTGVITVYFGPLCAGTECVTVDVHKGMKADEVIDLVLKKVEIGMPRAFELAETFSSGGQICKERRLESQENPARLQLLWPRVGSSSAASPTTEYSNKAEYRFYLRKKDQSLNRQTSTGGWVEFQQPSATEKFLSTFLQPTMSRDCPDLCNLPDLNEATLMESLRTRFNAGNIYTYVGTILIALNPFKFFPIYNPKYVQMYQNRALSELPPHIFAIADSAYHKMLKDRSNQCIVISGESGSGKTESTNLLLHHLSALSQRGLHNTGIEQTILGAGPVLEAFGNAKTVHNNNSSRFGKFIQVNYKENGMVHGAVVEKYLLEKSRIVFQTKNERNYHVFYYLLSGATSQERESLLLLDPQDYTYLNQSGCVQLEDIDGEPVDDAHEFNRLRQSMEMVGFSPETQKRIFSVLAAVLYLGNVEYKRKADHHHHEAVSIKNMHTIDTIASLLKVKPATLIDALTKKKTKAGGESVVMSYNLPDAMATKDAMAKCLYGGLFDWIVLQVNHALLAKRDYNEHQGHSIGVLDIFGFEDFGMNSFEQFCINYANEHLHYYFNQHIFKFEQEEYTREGIEWKNIEYIDNTECVQLFARKRTGLLALLDEECNFPGATNETLLAKFHASHQSSDYYEVPQMKEDAFLVQHYAGMVKYRIGDFREKNNDLMRHDIMVVLKNSSFSFVRELVGYDPVAVLRWAILRAFFRAYFAFKNAGKRYQAKGGSTDKSLLRRHSHTQNTGFYTPAQSHDMNSTQIRNAILQSSRQKSAGFGSLVANGGYHSDPETPEEKPEFSRSRASMRARSRRSHDYVPTSYVEPPKSPVSKLDGELRQKTERILSKNKSFKPRARATKPLRDLRALKSLSSKTQAQPSRTSKGKTKAPSVSAQFHHSLGKLMDTLNHANPFFIRCIKSNADKAPCQFDNAIVLRQLRYTGMLATVKIRQSGYNYRLSFEEFIQQYQALLPNGLLSSKENVKEFLQTLDLNMENYQIGSNKIFLREAEKFLLDDALHRAIMVRIVVIQRWLKTQIERKRYERMRTASITIQSQVRTFLAQRRLHSLKMNFYACVLIQRVFRGFRERKRLEHLYDACVVIQKHCRAYQARRYVNALRVENLQIEEKARRNRELELIELYNQESDKVRSNIDSIEDYGYREPHKKTRSPKRQAPDVPTLTSKVDSVAAEVEELKEYLRGHPERTLSDPQDYADLDDNTFTYVSKDIQHLVGRKQLERQDVSDIMQLDEAHDHSKTIQSETYVSHHSDSTPTTPSSLHESSHARFPIPLSTHVSPPDAKSKAQVSSTVRTRSKYVTDLSATTRTYKTQTDSVDGAISTARLSGAKQSVQHSTYKTQQQGPADYEVHVKSAAIQNVTIDELSTTYTVPTAKLVKNVKPLSPPLQRQQSFALDETIQDVFESPTARLQSGATLEPPPPPFQPTSVQTTLVHRQDSAGTDVSDHGLSEGVASPTTSGSHFSPLNRAATRLKNLMTGGRKTSNPRGSGTEDSDGEETDDVTSPRVMQHSRDNVFMEDSHHHVQLQQHHVMTQQPMSMSLTSSLHAHKYTESSTSKRTKSTTQITTTQTSGTKGKNSPQSTKKSTTTQSQQSINMFAVSRKQKRKQRKQQKIADDFMIGDVVVDVEQLAGFLHKKIDELKKQSNRRRETSIEHAVKVALEDFKHFLIIKSYDALMQEGAKFTYCDLLDNFEKNLQSRSRVENSDEATTVEKGIKSLKIIFTDFEKRKKANELNKQESAPAPKIRRIRKKKETTLIHHGGHRYYPEQFNIPTYCELCSSIIWPVKERGFVCTDCRYTVHKKCSTKSTQPCKGYAKEKKEKEKVDCKLIGSPLCIQLKPGFPTPPVIHKLLQTIEQTGLSTEGLYRKAGAAGKVRQLVAEINREHEKVDLEEYHIHVIASVTKTYLRELPEPLLTYDLYDDFLRASECSNDDDCFNSIFPLCKRIPDENYALLEELMFHLAKVAKFEHANKMSPNGLAIVFAPSILRTNKQLPAQESLQHVSKQTRCLCVLINMVLRTMHEKLLDIGTLDSAAESTMVRLDEIRNCDRRVSTASDTSSITSSVRGLRSSNRKEEQALNEQLEHIKKEKQKLTISLGVMENPHSSSEEDLLSAGLDAHVPAPDEEMYEPRQNEEYATTFEYPATSPPTNMRHLNKHRAPTPVKRRPPSKKKVTSMISSHKKKVKVARPALTLPELQQIGDEIIV